MISSICSRPDLLAVVESLGALCRDAEPQSAGPEDIALAGLVRLVHAVLPRAVAVTWGEKIR